MDRATLLLIGKLDRMEPAVVAALKAVTVVRAYGTLSDALREEATADLIVVLQHWPDEYSAVEIRSLMEACPLARWIVVQGPWCLSQRRNGMLWPAAVCVPVEHCAGRLERELQVLAGKRPPLPWTAGLDEIFSFDHGSAWNDITPTNSKSY